MGRSVNTLLLVRPRLSQVSPRCLNVSALDEIQCRLQTNDARQLQAFYCNS